MERVRTSIDDATRLIRQQILDGVFAPGQRMIEADMTRRLGFSRGLLREALSRLAAEGLVEIERFKGAVVKRFTRREVAEMYGILELLEGEVARAAATRIELDDYRRRLRAATDHHLGFLVNFEPALYLESSQRFLDLLSEIADNQTLITVLGNMRVVAFPLQFRHLMKVGTSAVSIEAFSRVAEAVLAGDPDAAERTMREHMRSAGARILQLPDSAFG